MIEQVAPVVFVFAGREANMEVQRPFLDRLMTDYPQMELHLWDLTRTPEDAEYLATRHGEHEGRVRVIKSLHPGHPIVCRYPDGAVRLKGYPPCLCILHHPPYEQPYIGYARNRNYDEETVFVKIDDDVVFLETDSFEHFLNAILADPTRVVSANVVNNAVCAKYDPVFSQGWSESVGDPSDPANDKAWWALHEDADFAAESHQRFLQNWQALVGFEGQPFRTREGEKVSINCIGLTGKVMKRLSRMLAANPRFGDEATVDSLLPWIVPSFRVAHLAFGPQEREMQGGYLDTLRSDYARVGKEYLS